MSPLRWDIVALGECMVELFEEPARSGTFRRSVGGDTLNTLAMASRLGATTAYMTLLADDPLARPIRETLAAHNVDQSFVKVGPGFNGLYFIEVDAKGERSFHYLRQGSAASRITPDDVDESALHRARIVYASGISQAISDSSHAAVVKAFRTAKAAHRTTAFDLNFRPRLISKDEATRRLAEVLPYLDVLFLSEEDVPVAGHLWRQIPTVVFKRGKAPVEIHDQKDRRVLSVTPPKVSVVDTSGAGDVFNGAFLQALAAGHALERAAAKGAAAAALQVTARGTLTALPKRPEVTALAEILPVVHRPVG